MTNTNLTPLHFGTKFDSFQNTCWESERRICGYFLRVAVCLLLLCQSDDVSLRTAAAIRVASCVSCGRATSSSQFRDYISYLLTCHFYPSCWQSLNETSRLMTALLVGAHLHLRKVENFGFSSGGERSIQQHFLHGEHKIPSSARKSSDPSRVWTPLRHL